MSRDDDTTTILNAIIDVERAVARLESPEEKWEYTTCAPNIPELDARGAEGWEGFAYVAVGFAHVIMKRRL